MACRNGKSNNRCDIASLQVLHYVRSQRLFVGPNTLVAGASFRLPRRGAGAFPRVGFVADDAM